MVLLRYLLFSISMAESKKTVSGTIKMQLCNKKGRGLLVNLQWWTKKKCDLIELPRV